VPNHFSSICCIDRQSLVAPRVDWPAVKPDADLHASVRILAVLVYCSVLCSLHRLKGEAGQPRRVVILLRDRATLSASRTVQRNLRRL
jgi:hypothetical protein